MRDEEFILFFMYVLPTILPALSTVQTNGLWRGPLDARVREGYTASGPLRCGGEQSPPQRTAQKKAKNFSTFIFLKRKKIIMITSFSLVQLNFLYQLGEDV